MRLLVSAPFDLGVTLSLTQDVFLNGERTEALRAASADIFKSPLHVYAVPYAHSDTALNDHSILPYGVRNPYGFGLRFRIEDGEFTALWSENARSFWRKTSGELKSEFGEEVYAEVAEALQSITISQATLCVFALGLCHIRLHIDLPQLRSAAAIRGVFKAYEFGGYGDLLPGEATANGMLVAWREAVKRILGSQSRIAAITRRDLKPDVVDIAGFQALVLFPGEIADPDSIAALFRPGDSVTPVSYGELKLFASWYITLAAGKPGFEYDYNRLVYIDMCHLLAWEACRIFENFFTDRLRHSIIASIEQQDNMLSRKQLNRIRQFAAYVLSVTSINNLSEYSGDIDLGQIFDKYANLKLRHQNISLGASSLAQVEEDLVITEERRNARGLNFTLLALTVLSLAGVVAGIIDAWQDGLRLFPGPDMLISVIAAPSLLAMLVILGMRVLRV
jgi:hypothetical protein